MRQKLKSVSIAMVLLVATLMINVMPASAATITDDESVIVATYEATTRSDELLPSSPNWNETITTSSSWKTIVAAKYGLDRNVGIYNYSATLDGWGLSRADIRMLGKDGNVVWEEAKACPGKGSRVFWCGSDVYTIQIRVRNGYGTAHAYRA